MTESTELTLPERAAVALGTPKYEKELRELVSQSTTLVKVKNKAAREQVHAAAMKLLKSRTGLVTIGDAATEDAKAFTKAVKAEVARLLEISAAEEKRLFALRDAWDEAEAAEKAAKLAAEQARVDAIRKRIAETQAIPAMLVGKSSETISAAIESLEAVEITLEDWAEFSGEAEVAKIAALSKMREMLTAQQMHEAEAARLQAEREQLERDRAEAAERDRLAALERQRIEDEQRIERAKADSAALAERQAEQRRLDDALRAVEQQQAELLAQQQALREATEKLAREQREREEAEAKRIAAAAKLDADHEEGLLENARIDAHRAEVARQISAREAEEAAEAERLRRERVQFEQNGPGDVEIVKLLAASYDVTVGDVMQWMKKFDYAATDELLAAENVAANQMEKAA